MPQGHDDLVTNGHKGPAEAALADLKIPRYVDLIGNTPMVDLTGLLGPGYDGEVKVLAKCEFLNPSFSMKDRMVANIFDEAVSKGQLPEGGTVVAASSGNTGASVAMLAAARGYDAKIITTAKCSTEKMDTIRAYGAQLDVADDVAEADPKSYMSIARQLKLDNPDWFDVDQYDNLANPRGHEKTLGPEIWQQTRGLVSHFVAGSSTGGTLSGVAKYLKARGPVKCYLADPVGSKLYYAVKEEAPPSKMKKYYVEGVGKGTEPGCFDKSVVDDVIQVHDVDAIKTCFALARKEGLMVGGSTGVNVHAALELAKKLEGPAVVVTVLCDLGVKYLSKIYNEEWLEEKLHISDTSALAYNE